MDLPRVTSSRPESTKPHLGRTISTPFVKEDVVNPCYIKKVEEKHVTWLGSNRLLYTSVLPSVQSLTRPVLLKSGSMQTRAGLQATGCWSRVHFQEQNTSNNMAQSSTGTYGFMASSGKKCWSTTSYCFRSTELDYSFRIRR